MPQSQEEFYFALPYHLMDLCLYAVNHGIPPDDVAGVTGLTAAQVEMVRSDAAEPGGVLLRAALSPDGSVPLRGEPRDSPRRRRRGYRPHGSPGRDGQI